jgi:hypothetical protein
MDKPVDIVLGNGFRDALGAFDMNILECEVPDSGQLCCRGRLLAPLGTHFVGYVLPIRLYTTSECRTLSSIDCVLRRSNSCPKSQRLASFGARLWGAYREDDSAKVTGDLEVALGHILAVGDDNGASLSR